MLKSFPDIDNTLKSKISCRILKSTLIVGKKVSERADINSNDIKKELSFFKWCKHRLRKGVIK